MNKNNSKLFINCEETFFGFILKSTIKLLNSPNIINFSFLKEINKLFDRIYLILLYFSNSFKNSFY